MAEDPVLATPFYLSLPKAKIEPVHGTAWVFFYLPPCFSSSVAGCFSKMVQSCWSELPTCGFTTALCKNRINLPNAWSTPRNKNTRWGAKCRQAIKTSHEFWQLFPYKDSFCAVLYENRAILAIADGCNWGMRPYKAARKAIEGVQQYLLSKSDDIPDLPVSSY